MAQLIALQSMEEVGSGYVEVTGAGAGAGDMCCAAGMGGIGGGGIEDTATKILLIHVSIEGVYCGVDNRGITLDVLSHKVRIPILIHVRYDKQGEDLINGHTLKL